MWLNTVNDSIEPKEHECSDNDPQIVKLHIYDLDKYTSRTNSVLRDIGLGVFHCGVEVYGQEWCYGQTCENNSTGVTWNPPRLHPSHIYRETLIQGVTKYRRQDVDEQLEVLRAEWKGKDYRILTKNCINFADSFLMMLEVSSVPQWVTAAQRRGSNIEESINSAARTVNKMRNAFTKADEVCLFHCVCVRVCVCVCACMCICMCV
eukprot:GHVR01109992.1.p1 GENE.GHVR01109992.1~~GHVR01109992.1.p1  ORF type:complete len:206 (+),score=49.00 GHVR01109992.1:222-839(+)